MTTRSKTSHYKPAAEIKSVVIPLRATKDLYALFKRAAKAKQQRVSHWLREAGEAIAKKELGE